jgi:hypothetical protein
MVDSRARLVEGGRNCDKAKEEAGEERAAMGTGMLLTKAGADREWLTKPWA